MAYWWVNQGRTYAQELAAGMLWAPKRTAQGQQPAHWRAMTQVQHGDVVFHYANGALRAVSRATSDARDAQRPEELPAAWEQDGWLVEVRYEELGQPIALAELPAQWRQERGEAPFNAKGAVNQGYLYPLTDTFGDDLLALIASVPSNVVSLDPSESQEPDTAQDEDTDQALARDLLAKIANLRPWQRGSEIAPHKPLLLLTAFANVRNGLLRLTSFEQLEAQLRPVLDAFTGARTEPSYPFWRLQRDGLWEITNHDDLPRRARNTDPPATALRRHQVKGGLPQRYYDLLLRRPAILEDAVAATLEHLPPERRSEALAAVGWDAPTLQELPVRPTPQDAASLGVPYQERDLPARRRNVRPSLVDPDVAGRGWYAHEATVRALARALEAVGRKPLLPSNASAAYDMAWETDTTTYVAEVKSVTAVNEERQLRLGLGQVLRYRQTLQQGRTKPVVGVLVTERKPTDTTWIDLCDSLNIHLLWPDRFARHPW